MPTSNTTSNQLWTYTISTGDFITTTQLEPSLNWEDCSCSNVAAGYNVPNERLNEIEARLSELEAKIDNLISSFLVDGKEK